MKPKAIENIDTLLQEAQGEELFSNLVAQVKKDFNLASAELELEDENSADHLYEAVANCLYKLISFKAETYLNLLYIVDVPESAIKQLQTEDVVQFSKDAAFLVLKRCWIKVWYRARY